MPPSAEYEFETFLKHFEDFASTERPAKPPTSFEEMTFLVIDYMQRQYPGEFEKASDVGYRFLSIMRYLAVHVSDFDVGDYGVQGEDASMISLPILKAVHQLFAAPGMLKRDPSPEQVLHLAREFRDASNDQQEELPS
jgi:hypothetical protein